eukprot:scaffold5718_cov112-Skeletonema_dohrnii-CCMP3373.AAC.1
MISLMRPSLIQLKPRSGLPALFPGQDKHCSPHASALAMLEKLMKSYGVPLPSRQVPSPKRVNPSMTGGDFVGTIVGLGVGGPGRSFEGDAVGSFTTSLALQHEMPGIGGG